MPYFIAYDLGTGGIKASLYRDDGVPAGWSFFEYATSYPQPGWHEQKPSDWWRGVCDSTKKLLADSGIKPHEVRAVALSGHSLVAAPLDKNGNLLLDSVPIWCDTRASMEAEEFFDRIPYDPWYMTTGNGDPPETYTVMKLMWLKKHRPEIWEKTAKVVGSKDYVNFRLTGNIATDYSYASGSGLFNLSEWRYEELFASAAGISMDILPDILESHAMVGNVTKQASAECGLAEGTLVACSGVDNACMALGARGVGEGRAYLSLGSSAWIAVTSQKPILDLQTRSFIFAHVEKGWYTSGVSIFAAGSAWRWVRDELCKDIMGESRYDCMNELAAASPSGANGVLFNPTLSGGSSQNVSTKFAGAFAGITLATTRSDLLRAVLEGVAMDLKCYCLDALKTQVHLDDTMLLCGGGAKSPLWRQIFADVFGMNILKMNIDQDAASLGAAAIAARAAGTWTDYSPIDALHEREQLHEPDLENRKKYIEIMEKYKAWTESLAKLQP